MQIDGDNDSIDFGFDEFDFDLDTSNESTEVTANDAAAGTEPTPVETDLSGSTPPAAPVQSAQPVPPTTTTTQTPASQQPPAPPPAQQPQQDEQPSAESQPIQSVEEYVERNADAIIGNLASTAFKIDPTVAENLGFPPEVTAFIERRDAANYLRVMTQVNLALQKTLPQVVSNLVQLTSSAQEANTKFYGEFPELKAVDIRQLQQIGQTLRSIHPKLERSKFQTLWGQTAMQMLNIQRQAPAVSNGGRQVRRGPAQPFIPAGATQPQRNMGGNGQPQLTGIEQMNAMLMHNFDD